jgi:hypothetical protein
VGVGGLDDGDRQLVGDHRRKAGNDVEADDHAETLEHVVRAQA